ncbi:helicase-exonuclease AddAB subunit AddA [Oenococcus alcoholitolerans]|uniref:helicase-exonuclease AddAB subunit AddA n=1 Tax=Oenococcus alcoholitolerans TaxID=931074 RepID=UPI003F708D23
MKYSQEQQQVISHQNDENLLVAASAGSGKTTVLIEHVFQQLLAGHDIDKFLIATFTDAAALEMRQRLEKRIRQGIAETGGTNSHLQRQLVILNTASIGTLDSFSLRLIERYYSVIGLDPRYRILADQTEKDLMIDDSLDETFTDLYKNSDFLLLINNFASVRSEDIVKNIIRKINAMAETRALPDQWLDSLDQTYRLDGPLTKSSFFQKIFYPQLISRIKEVQAEFRAVSDKLLGLSDYQKYSLQVADYISIVSRLHQAVSIENFDWNKIKSFFETLPKVKRASKSGKDQQQADFFQNFIKPWYDKAKKDLDDIRLDFFLLDQEQWETVSYQSSQVIKKMVWVTKLFRKKFAEKKRNASLLDFADGEQFAYQILQDPQVRKEVQDQYYEVLVDEYQDVNDLQESIMTSVSNGKNMFMVGDLKQSIYGFRQADPRNFADKYARYGQKEQGKLIELSDNYRSEAGITDFTNLIFQKLMDQRLGGLNYSGPVKLRAANRDYPKDLPAVVDFNVLDQSQLKKDHQRSTKSQIQIEAIAEKILAIVGKKQIFDRQTSQVRPVRFSDITILERSHSWENDLQLAFADHNIPLNIAAGNFLQEFEISVMLSFLEIIDNAHQDIPLAAVLRSPIYDLNENQLAEIRSVDLEEDFYSAVCKYAQQGSDEKLRKELTDFLTKLAKYRQMAQDNRIVDLIWSIYDDTHWPEFVSGMPGGSQRLANLHALYQYARQLSDNHFVGLFSFIRYVRQLSESNDDFSQAPVDMGQEAVSVMTIHAAKGLEFPIVFLINSERSFNASDSQGPLVADFQQGAGIEYLDPRSRVKIPTLQKITIARQLKEKNWAEEMRLLYVALTRAEQQLYLFGSVDDFSKLDFSWEAPVSKRQVFLSVEDRLRANNYQSWIGMSLAAQDYFDLSDPKKLSGHHEKNGISFDFHFLQKDPVGQTGNDDKNGSTADQDIFVLDDHQLKQAEEKLDYKYPYLEESSLSAYHNVSELKRLFEDPDALLLPEKDPLVNDGDTKIDLSLAEPDFLQKNQSDQKISSAQRGTATHLLLEKMDWNRQIDESYLQKLAEETIDDPQLAASVDLSGIMWLVSSDLGRMIKKHVDSLQREQTFAMLIPAGKLYKQVKSDDPVLVHGIIDGYFVENDGIVLFDYKTDQAYGQDYSQRLKKRYLGQINLYAQALQSIYPDKKIKEKVLVGLQGKRLIKI